MGAADGLPVIHVRKEDSGPHDILDACAGLRQGGVDLSEDVDGLAIRVQRGDDKTFFIHGGRARDSDPWTDANGPRISDDRFPHRPRRNVPAFHTVLARRTIVGPAKNPRVNLATVRRPQKFREFVGGLVREFRRRLPAREVPPVPFLEVADDSEEIRLQAVMGGTVVQGGPDNELAADRDDSELVVSQGGGRISARAPHARLDEIPDDGEQAFEGLRLDGQVATRREGHEGFSRAVEQVHRDRAGGFQQASSGLHVVHPRSESDSEKGSLAVGRSWRRGRWKRASGLATMGSRPPQEGSGSPWLNSFGGLFPNLPSANFQSPPLCSKRRPSGFGALDED